MESFKKLAEALDEPLDHVYNLQEEEREQLMTLFNIERSDHAVDEYEQEFPYRVPGSQGTKRNRLLIDDDDDDDFVESKKTKQFRFLPPDHDLVSLYDQNQKSGSRRPRRAANKKANLTITQINDELSGDDDDDVYEDDYFEERKKKEVPEIVISEDDPREEQVVEAARAARDHQAVEEPIEESVDVADIAKEDTEVKAVSFADIINKINQLSETPALIEHPRDPEDVLVERSLPMMTLAKLQQLNINPDSLDSTNQRAASSHVDQSERSRKPSLEDHMNMLEKIAVKAPVHGDIVPVAWQRLINTRRKMINVIWKHEDVEKIDDNCDDEVDIKTSADRVSLIDQKTDETYRPIRRDYSGMSTNKKPDDSSPEFDEISKRETSVFKIFRSKNSNNVDTKPSSASRVSSSPEEASFRFKPVLTGGYRIPKLTTPGSSSSSLSSVKASSSSTNNTPLTIKPSPTRLKYPRLGLQSRQRSQSSGSAIKFDNFFDREMKQGDLAEDDKHDSRLTADDNPSRNELLGKIRREIKKHDM